MGVWARIQGFTAALLSGLIFIFASITDTPIFGSTFFQYAITYLTYLDPAVYDAVVFVVNILMLIADYTGYAVLIAAILILAGLKRVAKILIWIVVSTGIFAFAIPVFMAIPQGISALDVALNGISTKYALAVVFALLAKHYAAKI